MRQWFFTSSHTHTNYFRSLTPGWLRRAPTSIHCRYLHAQITPTIPSTAWVGSVPLPPVPTALCLGSGYSAIKHRRYPILTTPQLTWLLPYSRHIPIFPGRLPRPGAPTPLDGWLLPLTGVPPPALYTASHKFILNAPVPPYAATPETSVPRTGQLLDFWRGPPLTPFFGADVPRALNTADFTAIHRTLRVEALHAGLSTPQPLAPC